MKIDVKKSKKIVIEDGKIVLR